MKLTLFLSWFFFSIPLAWGQMGFLDEQLGSTPKLQVYAEFNKSTATAGEVLTLNLRGTIPSGWHLYSIHPSKEGPKPTQVIYHSPQYKAIAPLKETSPIIKEDQALKLTLSVHEEQFTFTQQLKVTSQTQAGALDLEGEIQYQICNNRLCSPLQTHPFTALLEVKAGTRDKGQGTR